MTELSSSKPYLRVSSPVLYCDKDAISRGIVISSTTVSLIDEDDRFDDVSGDCMKNALSNSLFKGTKYTVFRLIAIKSFEVFVIGILKKSMMSQAG